MYSLTRKQTTFHQKFFLNPELMLTGEARNTTQVQIQARWQACAQVEAHQRLKASSVPRLRHRSAPGNLLRRALWGPVASPAASHAPRSYLTVTSQLPHSYLTVTTQLPHEKPWAGSRIACWKNKNIKFINLFLLEIIILLAVQGFSCGSCVVNVR